MEFNEKAIQKMLKDIEARLDKINVGGSQSQDAQARELQRQMQREGFSMSLAEARSWLKSAR